MSNDEELVKLCASKDREAQKILFEKYASKMMGICVRYMGNEDDAKDVLQDGFVKVFTQIDTFRFKSSLYTWMSRIFVNLAINKLKRTTPQIALPEDYELANPVEEDDTTPWGNMSRSEILSEVQKLPEKYRVVINMYAVEGMTHAEISSVLDITEGSSKSRLSRARVMLKEQIKNKKRG